MKSKGNVAIFAHWNDFVLSFFFCLFSFKNSLSVWVFNFDMIVVCRFVMCFFSAQLFTSFHSHNKESDISWRIIRFFFSKANCISTTRIRLNHRDNWKTELSSFDTSRSGALMHRAYILVFGSCIGINNVHIHVHHIQITLSAPTNRTEIAKKWCLPFLISCVCLGCLGF